MTTTDATTTLAESTTRSLRYARLAGRGIGLLLLAMGIAALVRGHGTFELFKGAYFALYGLMLNLPYARMSDALWRIAFIGLAALSALFVFVMVAVVMFAYMAAAERGEKLGVPGFEGTLIFLTLLQVPVVLFQRKPDMLD